jgi:tryptophan-rich sensory protein
VGTAFYTCVGTAAWRVWRTPKEQPFRRPALVASWVQLARIVVWTSMFFGAHELPGGFVVALFLWIESWRL